MLVRYMLLPCVRLSVCHKSQFSKWLNVISRKQRYSLAQELWLSNTKELGEMPMESLPTGAPNTGGVG